MSDLTQIDRIKLRRVLLASALKKAKTGDNTAHRIASGIIDDIEREEVAAKAAAEKNTIPIKRDRKPTHEMSKREFLQAQLRDLADDLEAPQNSSARASTRKELRVTMERLALLDEEEDDEDPYRNLTPDEQVDKLEQEVFPELSDQVLLAAMREYARRHGARIELVRVEDGTRVVMLAGGWA